MADLNDETIRDLDSSIRELTQVLQTAMGITGSSTNSQTAQAKATKASTDTTNNFNSKLKEGTQSVSAMTVANKKLVEISHTLGESFGTLAKATGQGKDAFMTLTRTMANTNDSFAKYGAALQQASGALSTGLAAFGPLGKAVGALLAPITAIAETLLGFSDNLFAAKDDLAKFGIAGKHSTTEILEMAHASKFSSGNLQQYAKIVTSAGLGLTSLGGTVNQGIQEFSKLATLTADEQDRMLSLGVSMEQYTQNVADFVDLQAKSGRIINESMKREGYLQKAAKEYTDNLVVLAALSGEDVNTQKQKQQQLAMEHEVQLNNLMLSEKIAKLSAGTEEEKKEAARLQAKMDEEAATVRLVAATVGMDQAKALQHFFATGIITPEFTKIMNNAQMSVQEFAENTGKGTNNIPKFVSGMAEGIMEFGRSTEFAMKGNKEFANMYGMNTEFMTRQAARGTKSLEEQVNQTYKDIKANELKNKEDEKARAERLRSEQQFRENLDNIAVQLMPVILRITTDMAKGAEELSKKLLKDIPWEDFGKGLFKTYETVKKGVEEFFTDTKQLVKDAKEFFNKLDVGFDDFMKGLKIATTALAAFAATALLTKGGGGGGGGGGGVWDSVKGAGKGVATTAGKVASRVGAAGAVYGAFETGYAGGTMLNELVESLTGTSLSTRLADLFAPSYDPNAPEKTSAPKGSEKALLDLIASKESGGDYNILVGGKRAPLTEMKVRDVLALQDQMLRSGHETTAVGRYQIIKKTLMGIMPRAGVRLDDTFDETTQDKLGKALLEKRGLKDYLDKKMSPEAFADNLSMEWAALPYNTGKSYYDKVGSNKSLISRQQLIEALPKARLGGAFSGPNSGYPVMLHGMETVVPTPNPNTTLLKLEGDSAANKITSALSGMNSEALQGIMEQLYQLMDDKLSEMVDKLSTSNDLQDKLLKVQM